MHYKASKLHSKFSPSKNIDNYDYSTFSILNTNNIQPSIYVIEYIFHFYSLTPKSLRRRLENPLGHFRFRYLIRSGKKINLNEMFFNVGHKARIHWRVQKYVQWYPKNEETDWKVVNGGGCERAEENLLVLQVHFIVRERACAVCYYLSLFLPFFILMSGAMKNRIPFFLVGVFEPTYFRRGTTWYAKL